jgi:hypothetical protein
VAICRKNWYKLPNEGCATNLTGWIAVYNKERFWHCTGGKIADLVLLDSNPLDDISNTQRITAVVVNGKLLSRQTLDKKLAETEANAKDR